MLLPFWEGLVKTTHFDPEMAMLADRHYSRRTVGARQFCYSGRKLVLRNTEGTILFVWMNSDQSMRMDGQSGYNCAIFRNESARLSSEIILEAEDMAFAKWGYDRLYTYVAAGKIKSPNPGYCFKNGWMEISRFVQDRQASAGEGRLKCRQYPRSSAACFVGLPRIRPRPRSAASRPRWRASSMLPTRAASCRRLKAKRRSKMPEVKWVSDEMRRPGALTKKAERAEMSPLAFTPKPPASGFGAPTPKEVKMATALKHHRKKHRG